MTTTTRTTDTTEDTTTMKTYTIRYSSGTANTEHETMDAAIDALGDVEVGDEEQDGLLDEDGRQPMRRLVWSSADEAEGDDGAKAVASICWTE
jgi:hypothetical protein